MAQSLEHMDPGIRDRIDRCREAGLSEPEFKVDGGNWITTLRRKAAVGGGTPEVERLLGVVRGEMSRAEIMAALDLRDEEHFRRQYLQAGIAAGMLEMTRPEAPRSRMQKYRLTERGRQAARNIGSIQEKN